MRAVSRITHLMGRPHIADDVVIYPELGKRLTSRGFEDIGHWLREVRPLQLAKPVRLAPATMSTVSLEFVAGHSPFRSRGWCYNLVDIGQGIEQRESLLQWRSLPPMSFREIDAGAMIGL